MTFLYLVRRTHLYLGLCLLPWVLLFAVSSIPLNHTYQSPPPNWTPLTDVPFTAEPPAEGEDIRAFGRMMMDAAGVSGGFYVNRVNPTQIFVHHPNVLHPVRIMYYSDRKRLVAERREFDFTQSLIDMHTRGGYSLDGFGDTVWAVFVDIVSVALIVWILSGLVMWWKLPGTGLRRWGWLALAGGALSFGVIMATL